MQLEFHMISQNKTFTLMALVILIYQKCFKLCLVKRFFKNETCQFIDWCSLQGSGDQELCHFLKLMSSHQYLTCDYRHLIAFYQSADRCTCRLSNKFYFGTNQTGHIEVGSPLFLFDIANTTSYIYNKFSLFPKMSSFWSRSRHYLTMK